MSSLKSMFQPKLPPIPKPEPEVRMADPFSPIVQQARRKKRADLIAAKGPESTNRTGPGTAAFTNTVLGQA